MTTVFMLWFQLLTRLTYTALLTPENFVQIPVLSKPFYCKAFCLKNKCLSFTFDKQAMLLHYRVRVPFFEKLS